MLVQNVCTFVLKLQKMATKNAEIQVTRQKNKHSGNLEKIAADDGARLLELDSLDHIVCFDMAQLQGSERVGASVVFRKGRPSKKEYRTYIVKTEVLDDLRMMSEVVACGVMKRFPLSPAERIIHA